MKPKFDEDGVVVAAPVIDVGSQAGKAAAEAVQLCLCGLDAEGARCERLHKNDISMQQLRQSLRRWMAPELGEPRDELLCIGSRGHAHNDAVNGLPPGPATLPSAAKSLFACRLPDFRDQRSIFPIEFELVQELAVSWSSCR